MRTYTNKIDDLRAGLKSAEISEITLQCGVTKWRLSEIYGRITIAKEITCFVFSDFESVGDDEPTVVATARGYFTSRGGILTSEETGVSIYIPSGAIPPGIEQEIYFKVCNDNAMLPPLDTEKGKCCVSCFQTIYVLFYSLYFLVYACDFLLMKPDL